MEIQKIIPYTVFLTRRFKKLTKEELIKFIKENAPSEDEILLRSRRRDTLEDWAQDVAFKLKEV